MPPTSPTDAQLVRELLELYGHNVTAAARALHVRRETIARWRDKGAKLKLFTKERERILRLFAKERERVLLHLLERRDD